MKSSNQELLDLVEAISSISVLVVGDLILDRYMWGTVDRISPEAPVPVVAVNKMEDRLGGAGNAARNLLELNSRVQMAGVVGEDQEGETVLSLLSDRGADVAGVVKCSTSPTSLKTRVIAQAQQVVRVDREDTSPVPDKLAKEFSEKVFSLIEASDAIIVSDYGKGAINQVLWNSFNKAKEKGLIGAGARPLVLDPHPVNYGIYSNISLATPNRKEAEIGSGIMIHNYDDAFRAAKALKERWQAERMMITLGEAGMVLMPGDSSEAVSIPTVAEEVFDVSGAGDAVIAIYTAAIAAGGRAEQAAELANIGGGIVVSEVGTVPIKLNKLKNHIQEREK